jgi:glycosyltransferase involved in cell wall biosynthesis
MRIVHFTSSYPLFKNDVGGIFIEELVKFISKEHKIFVLTPDSPESKNLELYDNYEVHRFKYFIKKYQVLVCNDSIIQNLKKNPINFVLLFFLLIKAGISLYKLIKKEKIDIVHCHWAIPQGTIAVLLKKLFGLNFRIIITAHGSDIENKKRSFLAPIIKHTLRSCDVINTVSTHLANEIHMLDPGLNNINLIPMGTNKELFENTYSINTEIGKPNTYIFFAGRLSEDKAIDYLIKSFFEVQKDHSNLELWIAGKGNQEEKLKSLTINLGIKNKVRFLGNIEHNLLPSLYKNAEMFVSTSRKEGFGLVLVEALMSKCPVIALDVGGVSDIIINGKTGILIPQYEMKKLIKAINTILSDKELKSKLIMNGFNYVLENFTWEVVGKRFSQLYLSLN